jgi:hypothetical protein
LKTTGNFEWAHTAPVSLAFNSPIDFLLVADFYNVKKNPGDNEMALA